MFQIIPPTYAVGVTLLFSILPQADQKAFNWDAFGGTPPESDEPIAYRTISTLQPTPKWAKRIKDFLKRNRPRHPVEMLFPDNFTALVEQHKHIKRNMTLDPSWAWRRFSELDKLKGTTVEQIPDHLINFTFPDMSIGTYDNSKTDEALNDYINKVTIETDYDKLKAKYDPYDIVNNKSIDWGKPTYDDEEFDQFLQKRIGRLLLSLYACLTTGGEARVGEVVNEINAITKDIIHVLLNDRDAGGNNNYVYKHYFLDNVLVENIKLANLKLISVNFSKLINFLIKEFRRLEFDEIETLLGRLANNYANIFETFSRSLFDINAPNKQTMQETMENLFTNVLNKRDASSVQINTGNLDNIIKPFVETYDHSFDIMKINDEALNNPSKNKEVSERKPKLVNQINNVVNIYINNPLSHHRKKKRSILMKTTTYVPPWNPEKQMFPDFKISGICDYSGPDPLDSFYAKRAAAYDRYLKNKLGLPNNNSKSSFIFETFEYENPNKTRKSKVAQQNNIEAMRQKHEELRWQTKHNKSYQEAFQAKKREAHKGQQANNQQMKLTENQDTKAPQTQHKKHGHSKHHQDKRTTQVTDETSLRYGITLQDITNIDSWFRAAQSYFTRMEMKEKEALGLTTKETSAKPTEKTTYDSSYERYKRRKEMRRKHKERHESSLDETKNSASSSCEHCRRRRRRKHRKCQRAGGDSSYSESESSRRDRRRRKHRSSASSASSEYREKRERSYEETSPTTTTTTTRTSTKASTRRRSTKKLDDDVAAEDEPSEYISDVPSHELTSYHYFKEFSLLYFMHPNVSIDEILKNCTTENKWRTTWPWTTKKVRITKWRHSNVSWPPMSSDNSRSSQDSYDWGSGQSWIKNQRDEMKSVEHFIRDNLFSEINEAGERLQHMNITCSGNSRDQDLELSENEDRMADFSGRYQKDFRLYKAKLKEQEREYQRWSLSGGNYSTTTEFDWEIKITKNFTRRSFRKGGHDIVFDISGMTLDPLSLEQIEKNLDADYLWKYGKNRTKTTTQPTTTSTTTPSTTTITSRTTPSTITVTSRTTSSTIAVTSRTTPTTSKITVTDIDEYHFEEGKSITNSGVDDMTSKERETFLQKAENNLNDNYENVGHDMFGFENPMVAHHREERDVADKDMKIKSIINEALDDRMNIEDMYVKNKKPKMHLLHELPQLSPQEIQKKEQVLQLQLTNFLHHEGKDHQRPARNNAIRNNRRKHRRVRREAAPAPEEKEEDIPELNEENFNQRAHPQHPVFYLTHEDLKNENYKKYNVSFINNKLIEYIDDMFEELKLNEDESKLEKEANSIYYKKYLEKRTTAFFNHLAEVIMGDNKRAIQDFTYPPNYDFDSASQRDPEKEPYLKQLKQSYERQHVKSIEWMNEQIALAKAGKLNTAQWRKEAEEEIAKLPNDNN